MLSSQTALALESDIAHCDAWRILGTRAPLVRNMAIDTFNGQYTQPLLSALLNVCAHPYCIEKESEYSRDLLLYLRAGSLTGCALDTRSGRRIFCTRGPNRL